tara:strand:+ start:1785 stop:2246 length:462 start_codon:yes stop_codon:yes gene_type:complete
MSHIADVQMQIKDLDALKSAVEKLGGTLVLGQQTHKWFGKFLNDWNSDRAAVNRRDSSTFGTCDHAIKFDGINYEIGVVGSEAGYYELIYDTFGAGDEHDGSKLEEALGGEGLPKLKQGYGVEVTRRQLSRQGYRVTTIDNSDGTISVKAVRA